MGRMTRRSTDGWGDSESPRVNRDRSVGVTLSLVRAYDNGRSSLSC